MRRYIALAALPLVHAWDLTYFSDDKCATPATELKGFFEDSSAADGYTEGKVKLSTPNLGLGGPGTCTILNPEWTVEADPADKLYYGLDASKFAFGKVMACDEYGPSYVQLFTKNFKECKLIKTSDIASDGTDVMIILTHATSTCQPIQAGYGSSVTVGGATQTTPSQLTESYANPSGGNLGVMGLTLQAPMVGKGTPIGSYKVNCNPKPADVAAITLGVLAIVFAFAAIGLAVVAKGK